MVTKLQGKLSEYHVENFYGFPVLIDKDRIIIAFRLQSLESLSYGKAITDNMKEKDEECLCLSHLQLISEMSDFFDEESENWRQAESRHCFINDRRKIAIIVAPILYELEEEDKMKIRGICQYDESMRDFCEFLLYKKYCTNEEKCKWKQ